MSTTTPTLQPRQGLLSKCSINSLTGIAVPYTSCPLLLRKEWDLNPRALLLVGPKSLASSPLYRAWVPFRKGVPILIGPLYLASICQRTSLTTYPPHLSFLESQRYAASCVLCNNVVDFLFLLVIPTRIELAFEEWKSSVLTTRRRDYAVLAFAIESKIRYWLCTLTLLFDFKLWTDVVYC